MRHSSKRLPLGLCWLIVAVAVSSVSADGIKREFHAWGRFNVGSTRHEKITTQSYDAAGKLETTSVTDQKSTLTAVGEDSYTLQVETTVEVAGSQVQSTSTLRRGFNDVEFSGSSEATATIIDQGPSKLIVDEQPISCHLFQAISKGKIERTVTMLFYSERAPHLLKSEITRIPLAGGTPSRTTFEVLSLDVPWKVGAELHSSAIGRTIRRHAKGRVVQWSVTVANIPGGTVAESTKELDASGRLLRRSVLELLDYEIK